jgi:peptidoglycan hydrolase-like protein with peptidoglycan-binding domain
MSSSLPSPFSTTIYPNTEFFAVGQTGTAAAITTTQLLPVLRQGDRGLYVSILQYLLSTQGYGSIIGLIDGVFGAKTENAVRQFQRQSSVIADGVVGPQTWNKIFSNIPYGSLPILRKGSRGIHVSVVQQILSVLPRYRSAVGPIDGTFGTNTEIAVRQFQQAAHILPSDGIVRPQTWQKLFQVLIFPAMSPRPQQPAAAPQAIGGGGGSGLISTMLPPGGRGYYSYVKSDRQYGRKETIQSLIKIGEEWAKRFPNAPRIGIGDISKRGGGEFPPHKSHRTGVDVDIRPMRSDKVEGRTNWKDSTTYSRELTRQLIQLIRTFYNVEMIFFNDPVLIMEKLSKRWPGHDDHLHIRFAPSVVVSPSAPSSPAAGDNSDLAASDPIPLDNLIGLDKKMAKIYNELGKYMKKQASSLSITPADAAAVIAIESGGSGFGPDGRMVIRFENHVFYDQWGKSNYSIFVNHFRFSPTKRWQNHQYRLSTSDVWKDVHISGSENQNREWEAFALARRLNEEAAMKSISMGLAQIMGFNFAALGYRSVKDMFDHMSSSVRPQLDGLFKFISVHAGGGCLRALKSQDYVAFARCYNGSGQAQIYGSKIRDAVSSFKKVTSGRIHST